jgi:hypothetical protein
MLLETKLVAENSYSALLCGSLWNLCALCGFFFTAEEAQCAKKARPSAIFYLNYLIIYVFTSDHMALQGDATPDSRLLTPDS